jgi:hypothetical protein
MFRWSFMALRSLSDSGDYLVEVHVEPALRYAQGAIDRVWSAPNALWRAATVWQHARDNGMVCVDGSDESKARKGLMALVN